MKIDPITSNEKSVSIYCGTDLGVRNFNLNVESRIVEEVSLPESLQFLKNVHDIQFVDEEVYFGSENGSISYMLLNRQTVE
jgi:hypothetical protein